MNATAQMTAFKVKINLANRFVIRYIDATDEADACWIAKALAESMKAKSFDLIKA